MKLINWTEAHVTGAYRTKSYLRSKQNRRERMGAARARGTHTKEEWETLKGEFNQRCVKCGTDEYRVERDHIIPVYQGGSDGIDNIQPLCARCNARKGPDSTNWVQFRRIHGWVNALG